MTRDELDEAARTAYRLGGREALLALYEQSGPFTCPECNGTGLLPEDVRRRHKQTEGGTCACPCLTCHKGEYGKLQRDLALSLEHDPAAPEYPAGPRLMEGPLAQVVRQAQVEGPSLPLLQGFGFNARAFQSFKMTECNVSKVLQVAREEALKLKPGDPTRKHIEAMIKLCEAAGIDK